MNSDSVISLENGMIVKSIGFRITVIQVIIFKSLSRGICSRNRQRQGIGGILFGDIIKIITTACGDRLDFSRIKPAHDIFVGGSHMNRLIIVQSSIHQVKIILADLGGAIGIPIVDRTATAV